MALCLVRGPAFLVGLTPALIFMEGLAAFFGYRLALLPRLVLALLPRYPPALLLRRPLKVLKREFSYVKAEGFKVGFSQPTSTFIDRVSMCDGCFTNYRGVCGIYKKGSPSC